MSSSFGKNIKVSIFGESHSKAIGVVLDGIPAGETIDLSQVQIFLDRRAPGRNSYSTKRQEKDEPQILSGIIDGVTCGTPICAVINNTDNRSTDYEELKYIPRPGHADYSGYIKYGKTYDFRGGGHFSGRLTAPLCFAGAVCSQILARKGISLGTHIYSINNIKDTPLDFVNPDGMSGDLFSILKNVSFPVIDEEIGQIMQQKIEEISQTKDSIGGIVECAVVGVPEGIGSPIFDGVENRLAQVLFGIPAVKGVEFGNGFESSRLRGSENNDSFYLEDSKIKTTTNNHGGILGGITSGMPIIFRVAFKPTPSIGIKQKSVDLVQKKEIEIEIKGRHDPCIVPRAVPCVEAAAAIVILDMLIDEIKI